jgi:hypothetical protein
MADETGRKTVAEMVSDYLREAAVLIIVFIPLDLFVESKPFTTRVACLTGVISLGLLVAGIFVEKIR